LYRGELLEGLHLEGCPGFTEWLDQERQRIRSRAWERARAFAAQAEGKAEGGEVLAAARLAVSLRPLDEASARRLIEVLLARGDRTGAEEEFERLESALDSAFGVRPSPEAAALRALIHEGVSHPVPIPTGASLAPALPGVQPGLPMAAPSGLRNGGRLTARPRLSPGRLLPFLALALLPWALYSATGSWSEAPSPLPGTGAPMAGGWILVEGDTPP
jgi:hypothetical protein